jgi:Fe-S-cluster containining protein
VVSPKLVSATKQMAYLSGQKLLSNANICDGCPYNYACCQKGDTYLFSSEAQQIATETGIDIASFATLLTEAEYSTLALRGVRVSYRLKTPCRFFNKGRCTIQDFKPRACKSGICDYAYKNYERELTNAK